MYRKNMSKASPKLWHKQSEKIKQSMFPFFRITSPQLHESKLCNINEQHTRSVGLFRTERIEIWILWENLKYVILPQNASGSSSTSWGVHPSMILRGTVIGSSTISSVLHPSLWSIMVTMFSFATISMDGWAPITLYRP